MRTKRAVDRSRLCKAEVLAARGHGQIQRLLERFVVLVLWEIEFCMSC